MGSDVDAIPLIDVRSANSSNVSPDKGKNYFVSSNVSTNAFNVHRSLKKHDKKLPKLSTYNFAALEENDDPFYEFDKNGNDVKQNMFH